ncbi:NACHT domain-containing protein [Micromonospora tulbaghiae]|uniref:NACHT domain-containing protein n=1 Tax=Micromonospora tulbaghiae TaxID=479978 RepID=UPI00370FF143
MAFKRNLSYSQAIRILSTGDQRISRLDQALGGAILGAAPLTGGATLALIDPKTEFISLLREASGNAAGRIKGATGKSHYELLEAAHTIVGLSAFFDGLKEEIGPRYSKLEITESEKRAVSASLKKESFSGNLVDELGTGWLPLPSPASGFVENLAHIEDRFTRLADNTLMFLEGLAAWPEIRPYSDNDRFRAAVAKRATSNYRDRYTRLAADIPEFGLWSSNEEHAATRAEIRKAAEDLNRIQHANTETLAALEARLTETVSQRQAKGIEERLSAAAVGVLSKALWRSGGSSSELVFPSVVEGFISPRYRVATFDRQSELTNERWWESRPIKTDLASFLASYIAHPDSAHQPLIILGHPGAGKSLLTEIVAARLPSAAFTPILVKLRRVNADAELHQQIETAIDVAARERISWGTLCRESITTKVVIFDGFDELIQATGVTQSGYIEKIAHFQEEEWQSGHSVIPIITSRTLVMDRVRVPEGSLVMRLEDFNDSQIERWTKAWNRVNDKSTAFSPLDASRIARLGSLARQPLLLTLLAIYDAEGGIDALDPGVEGSISQTTLYKKLLDSFIARQVREKSRADIGETEQRRQEKALRRDLALAAFAMFNRGHQFIAEEDLSRDLNSFETNDRSAAKRGFAEPVSRASTTIAAFFFVHVAQADAHLEDGTRQTYEFLHATFGEYLVAEHVCLLLADLTADWERTRERLFTARPDDSVFRGLLSHQPITTREAITTFAQSLLRDYFPDPEPVQRTIAALFEDVKARGGGQEAYEPVPYDPVARLANYTANLVVLAALCSPEGMRLESLSNSTNFRSCVYTWRAGMSASAFDSLMKKVGRVDDRLIAKDRPSDETADEIAEQLADNLHREAYFRIGRAGFAEVIASRFNLELHALVIETLMSRWPVPQLQSLTFWDQRNYERILEHLRKRPKEQIFTSTLLVLINLLVDDGPWLPRKVVSDLTGAALSRMVDPDQGALQPPLPSLYSLVARCPYLLDDHRQLAPYLLKGGKVTAIEQLLIARSVTSLPHPFRDMFRESEGWLSTKVRSEDYGEGVVGPDILRALAATKAPDSHVLTALASMLEFRGIAWRSIEPVELLALISGRRWRRGRRLLTETLRDYLSFHGRQPPSLGMDAAVGELRRLANEASLPQQRVPQPDSEAAQK